MKNSVFQQKGVTLISLLIGMLISMMAILASLTLYKNLVHVSAEAKLDSLHDGQLASSMLTTQLEILAAGYGIDDANGAHVTVVDGGNTIALYWRYFDDPNFVCRKLEEVQTNDVDVDYSYRTLTLSGSAACDGVTPLADLAWDQDLGVLGRWNLIEPLTTYIGNNQKLFDMNLADGVCAPLGSNNPTNHIVATITAPGTAFLNGAANTDVNSYQFCLSNTIGI